MNIVGPERYVLADHGNVICRGVRARNVEVLRHRDVTEAEAVRCQRRREADLRRPDQAADSQPSPFGMEREGRDRLLRLRLAAPPRECIPGRVGSRQPPTENECVDIETVEDEVVFLIRSAGQWPKDQTEIHFHPSTDVHRAVARSIMARYGALSLRTHPASP